MRRNKWSRAGFAAALVLPLAVVTWASPGNAAPVGGLNVGQSLQPTDRVSAAKAPTSRLAQTDPTLLNRTESTRIPVLVKLDYDPVATYGGGVAGLAATSPGETGSKLGRGAAVQAYEKHVVKREQEIVGDLTKAVPSAAVGQRLRTVYGGVSATVPANKVGDLLKVDGVVAVQKDELRQPLTDASAAFIGPPARTARWAARRTRAPASSSASSTPAPGRSTRRSPTTAT
ncbi:hypothetical protein Psuf_091910 [Phytohabitans suffuscus]|uniref:SAF domain-containing protein n=1 Tax=Phytohabitans suffuscus TaxID=624315 RepID=A0A6F8Z120_9ACTN|nr:hypothetical protein Psuf_091910 [Phytohabitans suffuscus]